MSELEPFDPVEVAALNRVVEERREHNRQRQEKAEPQTPGLSLNGIEDIVERARLASEHRTLKWEQRIHAAPATNCTRHPEHGLTRDEERSAFMSEQAGVLTIVHFPCPQCEQEEQRAKAERRLIARGIPPRSIGMTFDTWETDWEPTAALQRAQALAEVRRWCRERPNPFLILLGAAGGTGKTALGVAALRSFGSDIRCLEFRDWIGRLLGTHIENRQQAIEDVRGYPALMVDDFGNRFSGSVDADGGNNFERDAMGALLNYRFEHRLPTVITTNLDSTQFAARLDHRTVDRIRAGRLVIDASMWPSRRAANGI